MRRIAITFVFLTYLYPLFAGSNPQLDSLQQSLRAAENDTLRVQILFKLTWEHLKSRQSLDQAEFYADSALQICQRLNLDGGIAKVHFYYGIIGRLAGNYDIALEHFDQFITHLEEKGDSLNIASALYHVAVIYSYQGEFEESLKTYYRILAIYEKAEDQYMIATITNSIGIIYRNMEQYQDALQQYEKALSIFETLQEEIDQADCLSNMGNAYASMGNYEAALQSYQKAMAIDEKLSNDWGIAYQLENIGTVYSQMEKDQEALTYHKKALVIREKLGQKKEMADSYIKVGIAMFKTGNMNSAITYLEQAIEVCREIDAKPQLRDAFQQISKYYAHTGDFKNAYDFQLNYTLLKDSISNEEKTKQINELKTRYETEKKDNEINLLQQKNLVQLAQIEQEKILRNSFLLGLVLLTAIIFLIIHNHRQKLKAKELLNQKNEELHQERIKELTRRQKMIAMDSMITGQEKERKRIAQDLHDGLGVLLSNIQNQFSRIDTSFTVNEKEILNETSQMLNEACTEVRKVAHNMMPGALYKFGLTAALKDLCYSTAKAHNFEIEFENFGISGRLDEVVEVTIYRVIQESLINISKHAKATQVFVQLLKIDDNLIITIEDDGVGFDVNKAVDQGGMGLQNFRSRIEYLNGNLKIDSQPGNGTSIHIEIPLLPKPDLALQT